MRSKTKESDLYRLYHSAHEAAAETGEAIAEEQTADQAPRTANLLENNRFADEIKDNLSSAEHHRRAQRSMSGELREREVGRLLDRLACENLKSARRKKTAVRYRLIGISAAAAVVAVALINLLSENRFTHQTSTPVSLVLADGRTIVLDNNQTIDSLIEESDVSISHANGTLVVEKKESAGEQIAQPTNYHTLNVSNGYQYDIVLEDKTHVWLNSGSTLHFPSTFGTGERRVYVEGEAYFEVAKDSQRPFVVDTHGQSLTVLGTSFNIYAYRNEPTIYTTLMTGSIALNAGGSEVTLTPGQACQLDKTSNQFIVKQADTQAVAEWRNGNFVFDGNTLEQVVMKIARWYDVEIEYDHQRARGFVYKGNLPKYGTIEEMFESIEITGSVKFSKKDNKYVMTM